MPCREKLPAPEFHAYRSVFQVNFPFYAICSIYQDPSSVSSSNLSNILYFAFYANYQIYSVKNNYNLCSGMILCVRIYQKLMICGEW